MNAATTSDTATRFAIVVAAIVSGLNATATADDGAATVDLTTLQRVGDVEWRVEANRAEAGPGTGYHALATPAVYADARISVEVWVAADTNSGVFVRCPDIDKVDPFVCYEINIWDDHPEQQSRTGSIVTHVEPLARVDTVGKWNDIVIELDGGTIRATFNGVLTAELADARPEAGHVALQFGGGDKVVFRNLRIDPL